MWNPFRRGPEADPEMREKLEALDRYDEEVRQEQRQAAEAEQSKEPETAPFRWDDESFTWVNRGGDYVWNNPDAEPDELARMDEWRAQDRAEPGGLTVPDEWTTELHEPPETGADEASI